MSDSGKNLIITGHKISGKWSFCEGLESYGGEPWLVNTVITNRRSGLQGKIRYFRYFSAAWKIFRRRKDYKRVVAWDQFFGLILAFYVMFFRVKWCPDIYIMGFIYLKKKGLKGELYEWFIMKALSCGNVRRVFVYSDHESDYYKKYFGVDDDLFTSIRLGVEDEYEAYKKIIKKGDYFVAAGNSNRDYDFLYNSWDDMCWDNMFGSTGKLRIICDKLTFKNRKYIRILNNCFGADYREELAQSCGVIIPLKNENVSSGQLVAIHAAMFGKPVLYTKNYSLDQYIDNGVTGFMIEKTKEGLIEGLTKINNDDVYNTVSHNARAKFEREFSLYDLGCSVGKYVFSELKEENADEHRADSGETS